MAANVRRVCKSFWAQTICLPLLVAASVDAAPVHLDPTFGNGGRVFINIDASPVAAASLVLQSDGKLLIGVATNLGVATSVDLSVVRLNPDGTLDSGFGAGGMASFDVPGITASTQLVVLQGSGKIIVAGPAWKDDNPDRPFFALARYLTDGTLDPTFGSGGFVLEDYNSAQASITALLVQLDGRLVAAGSALEANAKTDMAFTRFNGDGSIDGTFGMNGRLIVDLSGAGNASSARSLVRRVDGELIVAGSEGNSSGLHAVLLALTADGAVDSSFGMGGHEILDIANEQIYSYPQLGTQSNGKILMSEVATQNNGNSCELLVTRLDESGYVDLTFGTSGRATLPLDSCFGGVNVFVGPDDHILISRSSLYISPWDYGPPDNCDCTLLVTRLTENGARDVAFGVDGTASIDLGLNELLSNVDLSLAPPLAQGVDGQIVVATAGVYDHESSGGPGLDFSSHNGIAVARLLESGASPGLIGFETPNSPFPDSQPTVTLYVRRTGGSAGTVSVTFETRDVTDPSGPDNSGASGTLTWLDGDSTDKPIIIAIGHDLMGRGMQSLEVTLSNPTAGVFLATSRIRIDIDHLVVPVSTTTASPPLAGPSTPIPSSGGGGAISWAELLVLAIVLIGSRRRDRCRYSKLGRV